MRRFLTLGVLAALASVTVAQRTKVCIFDIDDTLTRGLFASASACGAALPSSPSLSAVFGAGAVQGCLDQGYKVAIASAEASFIFAALGRKSFLGKINPAFNDAFFKTDASQVGNSNKTQSINNILKYYQITDPKCSVLFDDASVNGKFAKLAGANWGQASVACKGNQFCPAACGLSQSEYQAGIALLKANCN